MLSCADAEPKGQFPPVSFMVMTSCLSETLLLGL